MPETETKETLLRFIEWTKIKIRIHTEKVGPYFHEGEIWWASLGANVGYEEDGKNAQFERPVLVLRKFNDQTFWAIPITSRVRDSFFHYKFEHGNKINALHLTQLRLLSSKRLLRKLGSFPKDKFAEVKQKICDLIQNGPENPQGVIEASEPN